MTDDERPAAADRAWLADWRRRVSELYAEVRAIAADDPPSRVGGLAAGARDALPDAPAVAGPGRRAGRLPRAPLAVRRPPALDGRRRGARRGVATGRRAAASAGSRSRRSSCRTAAPRRSRSTGSAVVRLPLPDGDAHARRCSGCAATRAACSCRSATRPTATETYGAGRYLLDTAQERGPRRRPGGRHARPRLQLRVPAVVRVRPPLGVPARAAREPPRGTRSRPASASR